MRRDRRAVAEVDAIWASEQQLRSGRNRGTEVRVHQTSAQRAAGR